MKDEQINIRIAELQGYDFDPECARSWWSRGRWVQAPKGELLFKHGIPNYAADLNACHEFEKTLASTQCAVYRDYLSQNSDIPDVGFGGGLDWNLVHATARQRCEAFLRVHNQWKEEGGESSPLS